VSSHPLPPGRRSGARTDCGSGAISLEFSKSEVARRVAAYNDAIARVVAADGATLVDLRALAPGGPAAVDGVHLTPEGHARVAGLFADAL
jgi:hypothetical protein